jgi:hypothetical protein
VIDDRKVPQGSLFATPQLRGYKRSRPHPSAGVTRIPMPQLALDGDSVAAMLNVESGPQIGAALRWLHAQVGDNPELNTRAALSALLRFAPRSAWDPDAPEAPRPSSRPQRARKLGGDQGDADHASQRGRCDCALLRAIAPCRA